MNHYQDALIEAVRELPWDVDKLITMLIEHGDRGHRINSVACPLATYFNQRLGIVGTDQYVVVGHRHVSLWMDTTRSGFVLASGSVKIAKKHDQFVLATVPITITMMRFIGAMDAGHVRDLDLRRWWLNRSKAKAQIRYALTA